MDARPHCLTIAVSVSVPVSGMDVNALEGRWLEAARAGFAASFREVQRAFQSAHRDRLERREWRTRHVQTRLGTVRVEVLKVRNRELGVSRMLGMDLFNLAVRQRTTRWVERRGVELRVRGLSYRQAAATLNETLGTRHSAMWLWRRVQARGKQRMGQERTAFEACSKARERTADPPQHLYLEADEIHVKAQRSAGPTHRVKVGLSYTGRERVEGYRRPRYRLAEKRLYGGVETLGVFGRRWYAHLEHHHRISDAPAVLYLTDGDPGLIGLSETHFPQAVRHHDWAHVFRDLWSAAPDETRRARWIGQLCAGRDDLVRRNMARHRHTRDASPEAIDKVMRALAAGDFYGARHYRKRHDPDRTQRIPRATGGIEKNQEITIGRAMKKRGMAWSARGANHLAKLVIAWQDNTTWSSLWQEPFPP